MKYGGVGRADKLTLRPWALTTPQGLGFKTARYLMTVRLVKLLTDQEMTHSI